MNCYQKNLEAELASYKRLAIAFSGGCDSTFLAEAAKRVLGKDNVLLLLADSILLPRKELARAKSLAEHCGLELEILQLAPLADPQIRANDQLRCYYCKKRIFSALFARTRELGFDLLADGANLSDQGDYRPGAKAANELGVVHPLSKLPKSAIRELSKEWGLATWNLPASACLASRIPTGTPLDDKSLSMVESGEKAIAELGFSGFRVRKVGETSARLELQIEELPKAKQQFKLIETGLKMCGFKSVGLALYHTGSMNAQ
ncbi:MAG: ATP-dependent sacrificial sulfur transferase LarE [Victivallales bacterium]|nr:ATP-dependent sacrificial sulfur transferase LarE [Victivallales bacterium]